MSTLKKTLLVLDETSLKTGNLKTTGVKNLQFIKALISEQENELNFEFYTTRVPTEVRAVIFSNSKSVFDLKHTLSLPTKDCYEFKNSVVNYILENK